MTWRFAARWRLRRHQKKHQREMKEIEDQLRDLERIKQSAETELKELEYHEQLWSSVQLDKQGASRPRPPFPQRVP